MSSFSDLNNFSDNTVSFTDNRIPRPVFEQYLYAPDLTETINTTTFNPNNGEVVLESITRPADADLRYFVDVGSTGLSFSWGTLPAGVTATFTAPGYYEISNIQSSADFESITPVITIGTVLGEPEYSVGFKWVGGNVLDWTVTANIPVAVLESEFTLTAAALALSDGAASMTAVFSLTADPVAVEGSGSFTATTSMSIAPNYFRGIEAELDGAFTQTCAPIYPKTPGVPFNMNAVASLSADVEVLPGLIEQYDSITTLAVTPNAVFDQSATLDSNFALSVEPTEIQGILELYAGSFSLSADVNVIRGAESVMNTQFVMYASEGNAFELIVTGTNGGLILQNSGTVIPDGDVLIDWGDNTFQTSPTSSTNYNHTYSSSGTYTVRIFGTVDEFRVTANDITAINSYGDIESSLTSLENSFRFGSFTTLPTLPSTVTSLRNCFAGNTGFTADITGWNTANVTTFEGLFASCTQFNQDIGSWNVGNCTSLFNTFFECSSFNQDINDWDTSSVTEMKQTFYDCSAFNQHLYKWDTSNVVNMSQMFRNASVFNKPIGGWDTSSMPELDPLNETMIRMFSDATNFNQDLSGWCVENFTGEPTNFATGSSLTAGNKPVWGTCPTAAFLVSEAELTATAD